MWLKTSQKKGKRGERECPAITELLGKNS